MCVALIVCLTISATHIYCHTNTSPSSAEDWNDLSYAYIYSPFCGQSWHDRGDLYLALFRFKECFMTHQYTFLKLYGTLLDCLVLIGP